MLSLNVDDTGDSEAQASKTGDAELDPDVVRIPNSPKPASRNTNMH